MGWLDSDVFPKMISVQSTGCCPIARAYEQEERFAKPFENAQTLASGLRVPVAVGDFIILDAVRESGGAAVAYDEKGIRVPDNTKVDDYTKKCKPCVQAFGGPYGMIKL